MPAPSPSSVSEVSDDDNELSEPGIGDHGHRLSADEVLAMRTEKIGSGLNQLDQLQEKLDALRYEEEPEGSPPSPVAAGRINSKKQVIQAHLNRSPTHKPRPLETDDNSSSPTGTVILDLTTSALMVVLAVLVRTVLRPQPLPGGIAIPHWLAIVMSLMVLALLLLGVRNVRQICVDLWLRPRSGLRVPLTDEYMSIGIINKFANSAQVREKGLKIVQYVLRAAAYSEVFPKPTSKHLKDLSKSTSIARRFFKFFRWVKHFEDLAEAKDQRNMVMRLLLYIRIGANFGADWAEDVCSLERMGILHKGTLSTEFMLFAEYCQLVLALVEVVVTAVRAHKEKDVALLAKATGATPDKLKSQRRKLALVRFELVKFVSDIGKAIHDCELSFSHEGVFIGCSLFSALVSTHKNMVKVLKK